MPLSHANSKLIRLGMLLHAAGLLLTIGAVAGAGFAASGLLSREWSEIRLRTEAAKNYLATAPDIRSHHAEAVKRKYQEEVRLE
jgi:hypothetical protein